MGKFYVYEHWRPDLDVCFYVGKGQHRRAFYFHRKSNTHYMGIAKKLASLGLIIEVRIVRDGMSEKAAYTLEKKQITLWLDAGVKLANKSPGGRGGMSGVKRSQESRAKQSAATSGRKLSGDRLVELVAMNKSPEKRLLLSVVHTGRKRPATTGPKIGAAHKELWADPEYRSMRTAEIRERPRSPVSEETRAKMRAAKTPEARKKISDAAKKQWGNPDFRKLVSNTMKKTNAARRK